MAEIYKNSSSLFSTLPNIIQGRGSGTSSSGIAAPETNQLVCYNQAVLERKQMYYIATHTHAVLQPLLTVFEDSSNELKKIYFFI